MRYIDADNILYKDLSEGRGVCWVTFRDWIKEMPTADVRKNVKGRWIQDKHEMAGYGYFDCSVCGADFYEIDGFNFCPNCGADMRGDNNEMDSMQ